MGNIRYIEFNIVFTQKNELTNILMLITYYYLLLFHVHNYIKNKQ